MTFSYTYTYTYRIHHIFKDVFLIDLPQRKRGYRQFTNCWVLKDGNRALVIDPSTSSVAHALIEALEEMGIKKVEYILLTHIHLDHAGAAGKVIRRYPDATVVVHPLGERHITEPSKLWEGSKKVLGEIAELYGPLVPVPEKNIYRGKPVFGSRQVEIVETSGHSPHHQSYLIDDMVFTGDGCGVFHQLNGGVYLRPATPPKFELEEYVASVKKIADTTAVRVCFGHFGAVERADIFDMHVEQVMLWVDTVRRNLDFIESRGIENAYGKIIRELIQTDVLFSRYVNLDEDIREREDNSIRASVMGLYRYLLSLSESGDMKWVNLVSGSQRE